MSEFFLSEKFQFLVVKFSIYLNRPVFVMSCKLHEVSKPIFWEKQEKIINLSSAESAQGVVYVNVIMHAEVSTTLITCSFSYIF